MELRIIVRKNFPILVRVYKISDLDLSKCSQKFINKNFDKDFKVGVKCDKFGEPELRGKKQQYRTYEL